MKIHRTERKKVRMEMIPLIDVTFQLLSFFIYVSLFMALQKGIPLSLPKADMLTQDNTQAMEVSLDAQGEIFLEGEHISLELLAQRIQAKAGSGEVDKVILRGDQAVSYQRIIEVLDTIRSSGLNRVFLEAQPRGSK
ncbi:MAG: biopolymer transporter ExbD [bacterium]